MSLGHVGRMSDSRLPEQVLFASLPPKLGNILGKDLAHIEIDKRGWLQYCNAAEANQTWLEKIRGCAYWYHPQSIDPCTDPPTREAGKPRSMLSKGGSGLGRSM